MEKGMVCVVGKVIIQILWFCYKVSHSSSKFRPEKSFGYMGKCSVHSCMTSSGGIMELNNNKRLQSWVRRHSTQSLYNNKSSWIEWFGKLSGSCRTKSRNCAMRDFFCRTDAVHPILQPLVGMILSRLGKRRSSLETNHPQEYCYCLVYN